MGIVLTVLVLKGLDLMLYPCTFMRNDIHTVVNEEFQDIYVGTSHGKMGISPAEMEKINNRTGHNLCVGGEYAIDIYHMIRLINEKQHPERVIYEVDPNYYVTEKQSGNNYLLFYHEFPFSKAKVEYYIHGLLDKDIRTMLLPWYEYGFQYEVSNVKETLYRKLTRNYDISYLKGRNQAYEEDGFIGTDPVDISNMEVKLQNIFYEGGVKEQNIEYLKKIVQYCKEEGIQFIAITTPMPDTTLEKYKENYSCAGRYFTEFFQKLDVPYYDFNHEYYDFASHYEVSFTDYDGHMNRDAAKGFSAILAELLR